MWVQRLQYQSWELQPIAGYNTYYLAGLHVVSHSHNNFKLVHLFFFQNEIEFTTADQDRLYKLLLEAGIMFSGNNIAMYM